MYYIGEINEQNTQYVLQANKYLERIIEKDNMYNQKMLDLRNQLIIINKRLNDEINKPEYQCPIPDAGIQLLNDALKGTTKH